MSVNGASLHSWSFDAMNVLTWAEEAGVSSAWLQFMALPGGPVFLGSLKTADTPEDAGPPLQLAHFLHTNSYEGRHAHIQAKRQCTGIWLFEGLGAE